MMSDKQGHDSLSHCGKIVNWKTEKQLTLCSFGKNGVSTGIRTPVTPVKGQGQPKIDPEQFQANNAKLSQAGEIWSVYLSRHVPPYPSASLNIPPYHYLECGKFVGFFTQTSRGANHSGIARSIDCGSRAADRQTNSNLCVSELTTHYRAVRGAKDVEAEI